MRRLRAGALSAVCLSAVLAASLSATSRAEAAQPCPALDAARAAFAAAEDPKAAELALEAARQFCGAPIVPTQNPAPAPSFSTEVEPNDVPATPTNVDLVNGVGILAGEINGPGDVDFYRFFAPAAGRIWILVDSGGFQLPGASSRDTKLDLYGVDGATLIESDDDDGTATGGAAASQSGLASSIAGRSIPAAACYIRVTAFGSGDVIRPYRLLVLFTTTAGTPESEPNNTAATANALTGPLALATGSIGAAGDSDYYSIALQEDSILVISADGDPERDGVGTDLVVELRNAADQLILSIDSSAAGSLSNPPSEAATFTIATQATYYIRVRHFSATGTGTYNLAVGTVSVSRIPTGLGVDGPGNGVWEPGETVEVRPSWFNQTGSAASFTATLAALTGPAGATYAIPTFVADYGPIAGETSGACTSCYSISVTNASPRPAVHWDATAHEGLAGGGFSKHWELHIGGSFGDVPTSNPFYPYVETILHNAVTGGCTGTTYCPSSPALRKQMAVFVLKAMFGSTYQPPMASGIFTDVSSTDPFAPWIEDLFNRGIVAGCGAGPAFCPDSPVNRQQMSVFLLKTLLGSGYAPPACTGVFADVPCSNPFAPWIEDLYSRHIAAGCGGSNFCPSNPTTRGQMAPFLSNTFGLKLYAP
ncbi:MAG TPA: S-layer homology domain-containing protein [Thermoanaerobaculia bacterium]|nr:S-layer homology domain-containing protein [Thermoanaerobaculia bacterium]